MSTAGCAAGLEMADAETKAPGTESAPSNRASKPLRGLFVGFATTVTVGLALTVWYVSERMGASADTPAVAAVPLPTPQAVSPAPLPIPVTAPVRLPNLYLEVASL